MRIQSSALSVGKDHLGQFRRKSLGPPARHTLTATACWGRAWRSCCRCPVFLCSSLLRLQRCQCWWLHPASPLALLPPAAGLCRGSLCSLMSTRTGVRHTAGSCSPRHCHRARHRGVVVANIPADAATTRVTAPLVGLVQLPSCSDLFSLLQ